MKLHILSDLHCDLGGDVEIPALDVDVVILAGDIDNGIDSLHWAIRTFRKRTLFVLGNHETSARNTKKYQEFCELAKGTVVRILDNDKFEYNGIRFLGCTLWAPTNKRMAKSMEESIVWLQDNVSQPFDGDTVVITHYSPLHESLKQESLIDTKLASRLSVDLREFIENSNVSLWVHGHIHKVQDYVCGRTRIVCNPRGYADMEVPNFDPGFTVEI